MGKVIHIPANYIVNNELVSAKMTSTEAAQGAFVLFCPVLLKKSRKIEATNLVKRTINIFPSPHVMTTSSSILGYMGPVAQNYR